MAALHNWQHETPCEISKSFAILQCSWELSSRLGRLDVQDEKTSGDTWTASPSGQGKISIKAGNDMGWPRSVSLAYADKSILMSG